MLNEYTFNESQFNSGAAPATLVNDVIEFNAYGLQNANIITSNFNPEDIGEIDYQAVPHPKGGGTILLDRHIRQKRITVEGVIVGSSQDDLEEKMDEFKKFVHKKEGLLKYTTQ